MTPEERDELDELQSSPVVIKLRKELVKRQTGCLVALKSAASRSNDAEVRAALVRLEEVSSLIQKLDGG